MREEKSIQVPTAQKKNADGSGALAPHIKTKLRNQGDNCVINTGINPHFQIGRFFVH